VVEYCLNCGDDIRENVFPHYCRYCLNILRSTGRLPSGLLEQMKLKEES
jgi:hypothetical protein